jgi:hypothetical protein
VVFFQEDRKVAMDVEHEQRWRVGSEKKAEWERFGGRVGVMVWCGCEGQGGADVFGEKKEQNTKIQFAMKRRTQLEENKYNCQNRLANSFPPFFRQQNSRHRRDNHFVQLRQRAANNDSKVCFLGH